MKASAWVDRYSTSQPSSKAKQVDTGHGLSRLAVGGDQIWVTSAASRTLTRIDGATATVAALTKLGHVPAAVAADSEAAWVLGANGWLWRFDTESDGEGVARLGHRARAVVCATGRVWVARANGEVIVVDPRSGDAEIVAKLGHGAQQLVAHGDRIFALAANGSRLYGLGVGSGETEGEASLASRGLRIAADDDAVWVACSRRLRPKWGELVRIDPASLAADAPHALPAAPRAIAAGTGAVWIACGKRGDRRNAIFRFERGSASTLPWAESEWIIYDLTILGGELLAAAGVALAGPAAGAAETLVGGGGHGGGHGGHGGGGHGGGS